MCACVDTRMHGCTHVPEGDIRSYFFISLKQGLSLNLELEVFQLSWRPAGPGAPPVSNPFFQWQDSFPLATLDFLHRCPCSGLRSSCSHSKCSETLPTHGFDDFCKINLCGFYQFVLPRANFEKIWHMNIFTLYFVSERLTLWLQKASSWKWFLLAWLPGQTEARGS